MVDDISIALFEAGFVPLAIESKALALARMFREQASGVDSAEPYLLVDIDDAGLDFLVMRGGQLYFEYASAWTDLADEKGMISIEKFEETLRVNLRQVMNFYLQHWSGRMAGVVISATTLADETKEVVSAELGLPIMPFIPATYPDIQPEWLAAVGAGLRGMGQQKKDEEVNLLGEGARDIFKKDRILRFATFWSFFVPVAGAAFVALFVVANLFLANVNTNAASKPVGALATQENQEMATLTASATVFNRSVSLISGIEGSENPKYAIIQDLTGTASGNGIVITHISFSADTAPFMVAGQAQSEDDVLAFKDAITADPRFASIDLPLTDIQNNNGVYSFSMELSLNPTAASDTSE